MAIVLALGAGLILAVVLGLVAALLDRRRRLLRVAAFGLAYCVMEITVVARCGGTWVRSTGQRFFGGQDSDWWTRVHEQLLARALGGVLGAAERWLGFRVVLDDSSAPGPLLDHGPVLALARHGGPGDSFALVHLLLTRYRRSVRIVLKDLLQFDPAIDLLLNRLTCCFLPAVAGRGEEELADRLREMARALGPDEVLLLFPEGGNWTPTRRRRAIRHLRAVHKDSAARAAELMTNVLPPRPAGVLACLADAPDLEVVLVAHTGLDRIVRIGQAWKMVPLTTAMTVRILPAAPTPSSADERLAWLTTEWAVVDEWIDRQRAEQPEA